MDVIAKFYQNLLIRWTRFVIGRAKWVALSGLLMTVIAVVFIVDHAAINTSTTDMLSKDLPFRKLDREMSRAFPELDDSIVVVIDGPSPQHVDQVRKKLAAAMARDKDRFLSVFDPRGEDFFRRNGLLYLDTDEMADLADRLAEAQPFLATLYGEPTLSQFFGLLTKAIAEGNISGSSDNPALENVLIAVTGVIRSLRSGAAKDLSWQQIMTGEKPEPITQRILMVQPKLDYSSLGPGDGATSIIRQFAKSITGGDLKDVRVRLTGSAALSDEELKSVEQGMGFAGIISLVLVSALLLLGLKSLRMAVALIITLLMGLVWTAAFAFFALGSLNLISVAFAVLFIGLSVDFGIHYGLRAQEYFTGDNNPEQAFVTAVQGVGGALALCAIIAAIGFYAFLPTDYNGLAELGLIAGTGMFIALFANLTFFPAVLTIFGGGRGRNARVNRLWSKIFTQLRLPTRFFKVIILLSFLSAVAGLAMLPKLSFDFDPLNLKDQKTESVSTLLDLIRDDASNAYSIDILAPDLITADALAAKLDLLPEVKQTRTLTSFVPTDQDEKLLIIDDLNLLLGTSLSGPMGAVGNGDSREKQQVALARLIKALENTGSPVQDAFKKALQSLEPGDLKPLQGSIFASLPDRLRDLKLSLQATPVALADIPESLVKRQIAKDGRARIEVLGNGDMRDRGQLKKFVMAVQGVAPNAIGAPVIILAAGDAVVKSFYLAGSIAAFMIALLLLAVQKRIKDVVLVFIPLLLAGLWTTSVMVMFDIQFNFANLIVLPLLFGLGVAGNIHVLIRSTRKIEETHISSTPRAVALSALTTIASFSSIALSSHPGTASMGVLLAVSVSLSLIATLVVLPALITLFYQGGTWMKEFRSRHQVLWF